MATVQDPRSVRHESFVAAQLTAARRRIRAQDVGTAALVLAVGTLVYGLGMVLLDRWLEFPPLVRQLALVAYLLAAAGFTAVALLRPFRAEVNPYYAARQVERAVPGAKNSVISWLDLHDEPLPESIRSAVGQKAAQDLRRADLDEVLYDRRLPWLGGAAGGLVLAALILFFLLRPAQFLSLLGRTFAPFSAGGIATRTTVTLLQPAGDITVPVSTPVDFRVEVGGRVPDPAAADAVRLRFRYNPADPVTEEVRFTPSLSDPREWVLRLPAPQVQNGFVYQVVAGDAATPEYRVQVASSPLVESVEVVYHFRPYLRYRDQVSTSRDLKGLRGTEVTLTARTNRTVRDGAWTFFPDGPDQPPVTLPAERVPEQPNALRFRFVLERDGQYAIRFRSAEGDENSGQYKYKVTVLTDHAPQVEVTHPSPDTLPVNGNLAVEGKASDDFGITAMRLALQLKDGPDAPATPLAPKPYRPGKSFQFDDGTYPRALDYKDFQPLGELKTPAGGPVALKPGQVIEYRLEAEDNYDYPDPKKPNVGQSKTYRVTIAPEQNQDDKQADDRQQAAERRDHEQRQDQNLAQENQDHKGQQPPDQGQQPPNQGNQQPNPGQQQPNNGQQQPGQADRQPGEGPQQPNPGQPQPNNGQNQNAGQQPNNQQGNGQKGQGQQGQEGSQPNQQQGDKQDQDIERQARELQNKLNQGQSNPQQGSQPQGNQQQGQGTNTGQPQPNAGQQQPNANAGNSQPNGNPQQQPTNPQPGNQAPQPGNNAQSGTKPDGQPQPQPQPNAGQNPNAGQSGDKNNTPGNQGTPPNNAPNNQAQQPQAGNKNAGTPNQQNNPSQGEKSGERPGNAQTQPQPGGPQGNNTAGQPNSAQPNAQGQQQPSGTNPGEPKSGPPQAQQQPGGGNSAPESRNTNDPSGGQKPQGGQKPNPNQSGEPKTNDTTQGGTKGQNQHATGSDQSNGGQPTQGPRQNPSTKEPNARPQSPEGGRENNSQGNTGSGQSANKPAPTGTKPENNVRPDAQGGQPQPGGQQQPGEAAPRGKPDGQPQQGTGRLDQGNDNDPGRPGTGEKGTGPGELRNAPKPHDQPGAQPQTQPKSEGTAGNSQPQGGGQADKPTPGNAGAQGSKPGEPRPGQGNDNRGQGQRPSAEETAKLAQALQSADPNARREAARRLEEIKNNATDPGTRQAAENALKQNGQGNTQDTKPGQGERPSANDPQPRQGPGTGERPGQAQGQQANEPKATGQGREPGQGNPGTNPSQPKSAPGQPTPNQSGQPGTPRPGEGTPNPSGEPDRNPNQSKPSTEAGFGGTGAPTANRHGDTSEKPNPTPPELGPAPNPQHAGSTSDLQLERFPKNPSPDDLKKMEMTPEEYQQFYRRLEEMLKRRQTDAKATDPNNLQRGTGRGNSAANSGARRIEGGTDRKGDLQRGGALAPPEYRDGFKGFTEEVSKSAGQKKD